ncbi:MAG: hypothetical protein JXR83_00595 [Deltaproteobacteria bacterium]|nr:hypothetical protein [Deltaproteobacteria bacterium]
MQTLPAAVRQALAVCMLTASTLSAGACGEGNYRLVLVYPDNDAYQRAAWVELYVAAERGCGELRGDPGAPRLEYGAHSEAPNLGSVEFGSVSLYVRVRDASCAIAVDGCSEVELRRGEDRTVRIALAAASGEGCGGGRQCRGGRCVAADGGASDAAVADALGGDREAIDRAGFDARADAGSDAARDAAVGVDSTSAPDAAADAGVPETLAVEPVYPLNGADWNDWVTADGYGPYDASDSACDPSNGSWCLHGGELRQVRVDGYPSCSGCRLEDELGLFDWFCTARSGGLTFYNTGLPAGRRLADLVEVDRWKPNRVTFFDGAAPIARSGWSAWWANPVTPLPDNSATAAISLDDVDDDAGGPDQFYADGTVFVLEDGRASNGYNIGLDRAAIAMSAGALLTYGGLDAVNCSSWCAEINDSEHPPDMICLVAAGHQAFLWLEGDYLGVGDQFDVEQHGIYLCDVWYSKIRSVGLARHDDIGFIGDYLHFCEITHGQAVSNGGHGFLVIWDSENDLFFDLAAINNGDSGFLLDECDDSFFGALVGVGNGGPGLRLQNDCEGNMMGLLTLLNNNDDGLALVDRNYGNLVFNVVSANNSDYGIVLDSSSAIHFSQVASAGNGWDDVALNNESTDIYFSQLLLVGGSGSGNCSVSGGSWGNIDNGCQESDPDLEVFAGVGVASSFVGLVRDGVNGSTAALDASGLILFSDIADWLDFENPFRGWANGAALAFLDSANRGSGAGGTCAQRDVSLDAADSVLRNVNGDFVADAVCPDSVRGDEVWPEFDWVLINAMEIVGDGIGDEDFACESDEACLYLPNIGAYQGSGDYRQSQCSFVDGVDVRNVTMYGHPVNGE